jgi:hypothetical protein
MGVGGATPTPDFSLFAFELLKHGEEVLDLTQKFRLRAGSYQ